MDREFPPKLMLGGALEGLGLGGVFVLLGLWMMALFRKTIAMVGSSTPPPAFLGMFVYFYIVWGGIMMFSGILAYAASNKARVDPLAGAELAIVYSGAIALFFPSRDLLNSLFSLLGNPIPINAAKMGRHGNSKCVISIPIVYEATGGGQLWGAVVSRAGGLRQIGPSHPATRAKPASIHLAGISS